MAHQENQALTVNSRRGFFLGRSKFHQNSTNYEGTNGKEKDVRRLSHPSNYRRKAMSMTDSSSRLWWACPVLLPLSGLGRSAEWGRRKKSPHGYGDFSRTLGANACLGSNCPGPLAFQQRASLGRRAEPSSGPRPDPWRGLGPEKSCYLARARSRGLQLPKLAPRRDEKRIPPQAGMRKGLGQALVSTSRQG